MLWRGKTTWLVALSAVLMWLFQVESYAQNNRVWGARPPLDFDIYYQAGQEIIAGRELYDAPFIGNLPFTYPPFSAAVFSFLTRWPLVTAATVWQLLSVLALLAVVFAVFAERKVEFSVPVVAIGTGIAFASIALDSIKGTFYYGQINLFLMLSVTLDLLPAKRPWAGVGVGLAAGLKLTPAFFGLNFLLERNWRALIVSVLTFIGTVIVGFIYVPDARRFWTDSVFHSERIGAESNPGDQSIKAVLFRELGGGSNGLWLCAVGIVVFFCVVGVRRSLQQGNKSFAMALSGLTAVLISPFSWFHHWVWLVPLCVCVACFINEKWEKLRVKQGWDGVGGWLFSQLGALLAVGAICVTMIPFYSKYIMASFGWAHPNRSDIFLWRQSFILEGVAIVVGYGLFALVMMIVSWHRKEQRDETEDREFSTAK